MEHFIYSSQLTKSYFSEGLKPPTSNDLRPRLEKLVAAVATPLLGALRLAPPSPSFGAFGAGAAGWSASLPVGTMSGGARLAFHFGGKWWEKRMKHGTNMVLNGIEWY